MINELFEDFAAIFAAEKKVNPIEYPIYFPKLDSSIRCNTPEELQIQMDLFVQKYGKTVFEFDGHHITVQNDKFNELHRKVNILINEDYQHHRNKNFD